MIPTQSPEIPHSDIMRTFASHDRYNKLHPKNSFDLYDAYSTLDQYKLSPKTHIRLKDFHFCGVELDVSSVKIKGPHPLLKLWHFLTMQGPAPFHVVFQSDVGEKSYKVTVKVTNTNQINKIFGTKLNSPSMGVATNYRFGGLFGGLLGYQKERSGLHTRIKSDIITAAEIVPAEVKPTAIIMIGGTATGKSTLLSTLVKNREEMDLPPTMKTMLGTSFVTVDSDLVKEELPEYRDTMENGGEFDKARIARHVNIESAQVANQIFHETITGKDKRHLVYLGTGQNLAHLRGLTRSLEKQGYSIHLVRAQVPLAVAKEREEGRFKATGRRVPESIIEKTHRLAQTNFDKVKGSVSTYKVYDTSGTSPKLIHGGFKSVYNM